MSQIDTATTLAALSAAEAGATGADLATLQKPHAALASLAATYQAHWTGAISTSKDAFIATATIAWNQGDAAARYAESLVGGAGPALTFDPWSPTKIAKRVAAASALPIAEVLREALRGYSTAIFAAYYASMCGVYVTPFTTYAPGKTSVGDSVRDLEIKIIAAIADANAALALVAYS